MSIFFRAWSARKPADATKTAGKRFCRLLVERLEDRCVLAVPAFSSLPGAAHTIYLDFDGHITQNTSWNSYFNNPIINSPAYSRDTDTSTFSDTELADIQDAWQRVAEDFYPFNVNVTTVDPGVEALRKSGTGDTQWGVRVVITADTEGSGAGGIAYIDSFNWNSDTPVWVYVTGGKNVAEAGSHEVGHSMGLSHDGTSTTSYYQGHGSGETAWAPIMGVGYYRNVSQWDRGEYYNTNNGGTSANYSKGPDDLAIITSYNGFGYRPDDHGNTTGAASALTVSGNNVSGAGLITTRTDVDVFSFTTAAGSVTLNISPFTPGPNLDVKANLYNSAGGLVASADSTTTLAASISTSLAAGTYYLVVDGTGWGSPGANPPSGYSDYGSIGRYTISGTISGAPVLPQISITDVSVSEAAGTATFTVSITGNVASNVTVDYATANGTASAPGDYGSTNGTLTFTSGGPTSQQVTVSIVNDTAPESTEAFFVNLSNVSGATVSDSQGQATISDNDSGITITDASVTEGNSGGRNVVFTVRLTNAQTSTVTVSYATQNGTATTGNNDYRAKSGTLSFSAGQTSKTISIRVNGDRTVEANETFYVNLSNAAGAPIVDSQGIGTIVNDDGSGAGARAPENIDLVSYFVEPGSDLSYFIQQQLDAEPVYEEALWETIPAAPAFIGNTLGWTGFLTIHSTPDRSNREEARWFVSADSHEEATAWLLDWTAEEETEYPSELNEEIVDAVFGSGDELA